MNKYNQNHPNNHETDPRLLKLIELLRPTPPRDPRAVRQSRAKFLAQVDNLIGMSENPFLKKKFYPFHSKEKTNVNTYKSKFALTSLFVIAALLIFLFGGTGLTVYAAQSALPGDALYPVKTGLEKSRLSLTSDDDRIAQIFLSLAQKRLDEIEGLIKEGRFDQIGGTSAEFERQIQQAVEALKRLAAKDPVRASELTAQLMTEISTYTKALTGMLSNLPEDVKVQVEQAIAGSESAGLWDENTKQVEFTGVVSAQAAESWTVAGREVVITPQTEIKGTFATGDMVKVQAQVGADGGLTALEIEAFRANGNTNDNQNANVNSNENENDNLNANDNANENENINDNEDVNQNENENINDDQNENSNEIENENENENGNSSVDESKFEFKGTVQTILPDMWVISGITVSVSPESKIDGGISVGDLVEVYATDLSNGSMQALVIKLEDSGSSINNPGDDRNNDNANSNDSSGEHDSGSSNENTHDQGGGDNENGHD